MTSRLRRMLLVNTRTSGSETSRSINEIDPRDGASITGENSVGKTTTMELFPLFFGTLPSQISETVGGREPMLRFVLPTPYSAIVFEYQVGEDDAHDLRCVVLRREDNDHQPSFRFVRMGFRAEAFVATNEQGDVVFATDQQMCEAYTALGATPTKKHDIASYRAVILGLEAGTKEAVELRRRSVEFGLGSRLTNLERLIGAVARERLDFKDFVRLAVTIVRERLSAGGDSGGRHRVTLRQSKEHIGLWLRNRDALDAALRLSGDVGLLRESLQQHEAAESQRRALRQQIAPLLKLRRQGLEGLTSQLDSAQSSLTSHDQKAGIEERELLAAADAAAAQARAVSLLIDDETKRQESLHLGEVAQWAADLERVAQLQAEQTNLSTTADALAGKSTDIEARYERMGREITEAARQSARQIRDGERSARARSDAVAHRLRMDADAGKTGAEDELTTLSNELSPLIEDLGVEIGTLKGRIETVQASAGALLALKAAEEAEREAAQALRGASGAAHEAEMAKVRAAGHQRETEGQLDAAIRSVEDATRRLEHARLQLTPADGSLLQALRQADPGSWRPGLARVINPDLLQRTDLSPSLQVDTGSVYGWQLNTAEIVEPEWVDDQQLKDALQVAEQAFGIAQARLESARAAASSAAASWKQTSQALDTAKAEEGLAKTRLERAEAAVQTARSVCDREIKELKAKGAADLHALTQKLDSLRARLREAQSSKTRSLQAIDAQLQQALKANEAELQQTLADIESNAQSVEKAAALRVTELGAERDQLLGTEGVDPGRLRELRNQSQALADRIVSITQREPTVRRWKIWLEEGGEQILRQLNERATRARTASSDAQSRQQKRLGELREERRRLSAIVSDLLARQDSLKLDVQALQALLIEHGLSENVTREVDPELNTLALRNALIEADANLNQAEQSVRRRQRQLQDQLTIKPGTVADFINGRLESLNPDASFVLRAHELCLAQEALPREVLPSIINDVTTIFQQIIQYRAVISRFETEIRRFNSELQRSLNVTLFPRIEALQVEIASNFGELDLIKQIDEINAVAKEHMAQISLSGPLQLPGASTAAALSKFQYLLRQDSTVELDLAAHVDLRGSVTVNKQTRVFSRPADLEHISSTGINAIILITLLVGMLNMIRGKADLYIPWITDEVGKFDATNFKALMDTLRANKIDPVTASPTLSPGQFKHFARRYVFGDRGSIGVFAPTIKTRGIASGPVSAQTGPQEGVAHEV